MTAAVTQSPPRATARDRRPAGSPDRRPAPVRVVEDLNRALHTLLAEDDHLYLLGEDIADPYGGAFKATAGLTTRHPDRVLSTPISEQAILGVANGLALAGNRVVAEVMFSDFAALAFDQVLNLAGKAVTMYGTEVPVGLVLRCPSGGYRGYGPTHSQSLQKHFLGMPNVEVYELSAHRPALPLLQHMLGRGRPCLLFEEKALYGTAPRHADGPGAAGDADDDGLFRQDVVGEAPGTLRLACEDPLTADCVVVTPGGMAGLVLDAARRLLIEHERFVTVLVPSRLYPLDAEPIVEAAAAAGRVAVVEQSTAGGTWGAEVAAQLYPRLWGRLRAPIRLVHSADSVIPAAAHLEREVLVSAESVYTALRELTDV